MSGNPQNPQSFADAAKVAATQTNTPVAEICEPCAAQFRVEAHYDDPWKTPITLAPLRVQYVEGGVISEGARTFGLPSFGLQDGQEIDGVRPDLGMHQDRAPEQGAIRAEIVPEGGPDPKALKDQIIADLGAFAKTMETAMGPYIKEWEDDGWLGLFGDLWGGITSGASAWWEGEGDFWNSVGEWLSNLPEMLGEAWDSVTDSAKALWENRDQILGLLQNLAEGAVSAFESGLEAVASLIASIPGYEEIAELLTDLVEQSAEWGGAMIEMATETRVIAVLGATMLGTFMMIPPNFWTDMVGKGIGYLIPELIIAIILAIIAFFTAGTGGAALGLRIATYTTKVTAALSKGGRAGRALMRVFTLLKSISGKMIDLIKALKGKIEEAAEGATNAVTRIVRKVRRHDVPCFNLPRGANPIEFDRQLAEQMNTINNMTADDMAYAQWVLNQARQEHASSGRGGSFTDLIRNGRAQRDARNRFEANLERQGLDPDEIAERMGNVNATHFLDIIAGGNPKSVGIGGAAENQGIGREWPRSGRATGLGTAANTMRRDGLAHRKMNVKLIRCP